MPPRSNLVLSLRRVPAALLLQILAAGCGGGGGASWPSSEVPATELSPVVARDARFAAPGEVPDGFDGLLAGARIVLIGNRHWIQDHYCFLVKLLPQLHAAGVRYLLEENVQAYSWMAEDYVQLRSDELPPLLAQHYRLFLEGVRAFNQGQAPADRMHFVLFDANFSGVFLDSLRRFDRRFGPLSVLGTILATTPGTGAYDDALAALPAALAAQQADLQAKLGDQRHGELAELVEWEARSAPFWKRGEDAAREEVLRDGLLAALERAGGSPIAVNTGAFHAQKTQNHIADLDLQPYGEWLALHPETYGGDASALRSVACTAAYGELMNRDNGSYHTDVREAHDNDVGRILSELAGDRNALLPLQDPLFRDRPLALGADGLLGSYRLGLTFDALVLYPDVSIVRSELAPIGEVSGTCR